MDNIIGVVLNFVFGSNASLGTFIISMMPLVELKGGIPIGMSMDFWGENALGGLQAFLVALAGTSAVIFILPLIFMPILRWLKKTKLFRKLGEWIESKVNKHSTDISAKRKSIILKCLGIFLFVALPLPMTGVWMGCCVGLAIGLDYWQTVFSVFFGNVVAGGIIVSICAIFPSFSTWLTYIVLGIIALCAIFGLFKKLADKRKKASEK